MKSLKNFIKESMVNESDPKGDFKVKKAFPTDFMWENYQFINNPDSLDDPDLIEDIVNESGFRDFLDYAEKKHWKKDSDGYYIIPKGTTLTYDGYLSNASHMGKWCVNDEDVYITMDYDSVSYGDYDEYLKAI